MDQQIKDAHDVSEALGREYMETLFVRTNRFYVDMEMLVDFRLTALLCLMTKDDYEIIRKNENMVAYNARHDNDTVKYFPGVSVTNAQITEWLKNPTDNMLLLQRLQFTTYFEQFMDIVRSNNVKNYLSGEGEPIVLFIGRNHKPLTALGQKYIVAHLMQYVSNMDLRITEGGLVDYTKEIIESFHHYSIFNLEQTVQHRRISEYIGSGVLLGKQIYAFPFINRNPVNEKLSDAEIIETTTQFLNGLTIDFDYVTIKVKHG